MQNRGEVSTHLSTMVYVNQTLTEAVMHACLYKLIRRKKSLATRALI
jgi:hypothetical protein